MFFFFFSKPYISIVGEVVDTKEHTKELNEALREMNRKYEATMKAKFMATINHEFQGIVCKGDSLLPILFDLKNRLYPLRVRIGIGIGEIEEESLSEWSITVKGAGYEKAREALEDLRMRKKRKQVGHADVRAAMCEDSSERMNLINTILMLLTTIEDGWSDRQREIISLMMRRKEKQTDVAKKLGITQSTVQKSLTAGNYYVYEEAFQALNRVFSEIGDERFEE